MVEEAREEESFEGLLKDISRKLYAGQYIYASIIYMVWAVFLSIFLIILSFIDTYNMMPSYAISYFSAAYWIGGGIVIGYSIVRFWGGYIKRLQASYHLDLKTTTPPRRILGYIGWILMPFIIWLSGCYLAAIGVEEAKAWSTSLLLGLSSGISSNIVLEASSGEKKPLSLIALAFLLASLPLALASGWLAASLGIIAGYTTTALAYLLKVLSKIM